MKRNYTVSLTISNVEKARKNISNFSEYIDKLIEADNKKRK